MSKWLKKLSGLQRRQGQTTAEYAIIVALVAVSSIAIILIFGDQIRALFAGETQKLAGQDNVTVQDKSGEAANKVAGSIKEF